MIEDDYIHNASHTTKRFLNQFEAIVPQLKVAMKTAKFIVVHFEDFRVVDQFEYRVR